MAKKKMNAAERKEYERTHDPLRLIHFKDPNTGIYHFKISSRDHIEADKKVLEEEGKLCIQHI